MRGLRDIAAPFVVPAPSGARVRTRLRVSQADAAVLRAVGRHLGALASADLAARCGEGLLDARGRARSRRERKRALTAASSSRWAGAVTRASEDQWQLAWRNLGAETATLRARIRLIKGRLAVPAGTKTGRARGYASQAERFAKQRRLQALQARLAEAGQRAAAGRVSVTRGGRRLLRARANLTEAGLTQAQWRERWEAERLFLTADGEKDKAWGNETIRVHPDEGWLEVKLPGPLGQLANRPHGRYRLSCPAAFPYRGDEVAAQAATGAVRYDITLNPDTGRWYLDASWTTSPGPAPGLGELRAHPVVAVDMNAGHLAAWALTPDGNPAGPPVKIPLVLAGLPSSQRDGRIRAAVSALTAIAREHGARAVVIENLNFAQAREQGRERAGNRPSRGRRGRAFRALVSGIPTARFRDRLVQMTHNAGLAVIAVDPAYTSRWGAEHWLAPLQHQTPVPVSGHHAAAVVIGRRGLGHRARRREGVTGSGQRTARRRAAPTAPGNPSTAPRNGATRQAPRQPRPGRKTRPAQRARPPDQAAHDRSGPPDSQDHLLLSQKGTVALLVVDFDDEDQVSYMAATLGLPVLARDGEQFGVLEHVLAVEEEDIFEGIVVWTGHGGWVERKVQRELSMGHQSAARFLETFRHNDLRFVHADKIAAITVGYIRCDLDGSQVGLLQPPSGPPVFYANAIDQAGPPGAYNRMYGGMFGRARWRQE